MHKRNDHENEHTLSYTYVLSQTFKFASIFVFFYELKTLSFRDVLKFSGKTEFSYGKNRHHEG